MFQFPRLPSLAGCYSFTITGCPIRTSTDLCSFAAPRSFSQLTTSFIASVSQGIHHAPLFASYTLSKHTISLSYVAFNAQSTSLELFSSNNPTLFSMNFSPENQYFKPIILQLYSILKKRQKGGKRIGVRSVLTFLTLKRRYSSHTFRYGYLVTT